MHGKRTHASYDQRRAVCGHYGDSFAIHISYRRGAYHAAKLRVRFGWRGTRAEVGRYLHRLMAPSGGPGDSDPHYGEGRHRYLPLAGRRLLLGLCADGVDQRLSLGRERPLPASDLFGHCRPCRLLHPGYRMVHGLFPVWPGEGNATVDGTHHDRISFRSL